MFPPGETGLIQTVEELSVNAWPALQTLLLGGWILRFAHGYTRRANSVNPLYELGADNATQGKIADPRVGAKIEACERLYGAQGLVTAFKLTSAAQAQDLDEILERRGYQLDARTSVQTLDLIGWEAALSPNAEVSRKPSEDWLDGFCRLSAIDKVYRPVLGQMVSRIIPPRGFFSLRHEDRVVGYGLAVAQGGYVGLFDVIIDPTVRRQGHGQQLVWDMLAWGKRNGAHTAYLQVMFSNTPACRLYAKLGFREAYQYWYRIRS